MRDITRFVSRHLAVFLLISVTAAVFWACKKAGEEETEHKRWKLTMIKYEEMRQTLEAEKGFRSGLADAGLREGIDYEIVSRNAQGDVQTVLTLLDAVMVDGTDMLISLQTPTFEPAVRRRSRMPLAFMVVANPFVIPGVGTSDSSHNPLVTGVYTNTPFDIMLGHIKACMPGLRRIGTLATNWSLFVRSLPTLGPSVILLGCSLILLGLGLARLAALGPAQATAISIDTGIQNAALGIAVGGLIAGPGVSEPAFSVPSGVYGVIMYLLVIPFTLWRRRMADRTYPAATGAAA